MTILFERGASTQSRDLSDRQLRFLWHGRSLIPTGGLGKRFSLSIRQRTTQVVIVTTAFTLRVRKPPAEKLRDEV